MDTLASMFAFAPVSKLQRKEVFSGNQLFRNSLTEKLKEWVKFSNYTSYWVGRAVPSLAGRLMPFGKDMGQFKNGISLLELYKKSCSVLSANYSLLTGHSSAAMQRVILDSTGWFNSFADASYFVSRYASINPVVLSKITNLNVGATLIGAGHGTVSGCGKMAMAETDEQKALAFLQLATTVSYLAFAVMSLGCMAMGTALGATTIMTCLTSGTVFGLASYFHERVCDPYHVNANVDLESLRPRLQLI